jgi:predicted ATP-dependent endonuclease of OLD family
VCDPTQTCRTSSRVRGILFAKGVIFVEGEIDYRVMQAFKHGLDSQKFQAYEGLTLDWDVVHVGGKGNLEKAVEIAKASRIPCLILCDFDALIPNTEAKGNGSLVTKLQQENQKLTRRLLELEAQLAARVSALSRPPIISALQRAVAKWDNLAAEEEAWTKSEAGDESGAADRKAKIVTERKTTQKKLKAELKKSRLTENDHKRLEDALGALGMAESSSDYHSALKGACLCNLALEFV